MRDEICLREQGTGSVPYCSCRKCLAATAKQDPWDEVFRGKPDLIASGKSDNAAVLFKMSRRHANILGAYLNGRNDIAPLPTPVAELLDALTLRLVGPGGARWAELRRILDGQPAVTWEPPAYEGRRRRPFTTPADDPDLNQALLGDADGTTMAEWPQREGN
jgi:hypothetical protein